MDQDVIQSVNLLNWTIVRPSP